MEFTSYKDKRRECEGVENVTHIYKSAGRVITRSVRMTICVQLIGARGDSACQLPQFSARRMFGRKSEPWRLGLVCKRR